MGNETEGLTDRQDPGIAAGSFATVSSIGRPGATPARDKLEPGLHAGFLEAQGLRLALLRW